MQRFLIVILSSFVLVNFTIYFCLDLSFHLCLQLVLGGISILLPVYGITNSKRYSVFHGILILLGQNFHRSVYVKSPIESGLGVNALCLFLLANV